MGRYLGSWKLEDITYVTVQTSSVTTGAATDAETAPTWRMYEDNTTTPVTTGSFTTLNSLAGFYVAPITLAAAIGYEKGKSYSLRVAATVGGVIGADVHSLQIEAEVDANAISTSAPAGFITAGSITDGALTSSKFGAGFITSGSFSAGAINAAAISDGALTGAKFGAGFITAGSFTTNALASQPVTVNATAAAAIAVKVWDEPKASHTTADTYGEYLDATVSGIAAGDTTASPTAIAAIADAVWDEARAGHVGAGSFGEGVLLAAGAITAATITAGAFTAAKFGGGFITAGSFSGNAISAMPVTIGATAVAAVAVGVWDEPKASHTTADTYGEFLDSTTGAIKAETAQIKAKTDLIFAGTANSIAADIRFVNGVSVTGNGQSGTEWGPGS